MFNRTPQLALYALCAAVLTVLLGPLSASAQSQLDTAEAQAFVGQWDLAIQSEMGPFSLDLEIADRGGKVTAVLGSPEVGSQEVTDITRAGEGLVLRHEFNQQGQIIPISLTLVPEGEALDAAVNVGDGMFTATGTATRAE
jgi:hypothetical protein